MYKSTVVIINIIRRGDKTKDFVLFYFNLNNDEFGIYVLFKLNGPRSLSL